MEGSVHREAGLKPGREPFWVTAPGHLIIHDVSALTGLHPRAPGAPKPPKTVSDREKTAIALAYMVSEAAYKILDGREDALATAASLVKAFTSAYVRATHFKLVPGDLARLAAAILASAVHAHGVPVSLNEVAQALGMRYEEFHRATARGLRILSTLGVKAPRSTPSTRLARAVALARRYAQEFGLPGNLINMAGELARALVRLQASEYTYPETLARYATYLALRLTGRPLMKSIHPRVFGVSWRGSIKPSELYSIAVVYPPKGSPGRPVRVRLGKSRVRAYCGYCGALLLDRSGRNATKPIVIPEVCPRCYAVLDKDRPAVAISRIDHEAEVELAPSPPGAPLRVEAVGV